MPFPNVTDGPTPEERTHNVGPHIMCVCVVLIFGIKPFKRGISTDVFVCVRTPRVHAHVCLHASPASASHSLSSYCIFINCCLQYSEVFKTSSACTKLKNRYFFIKNFQKIYFLQHDQYDSPTVGKKIQRAVRLSSVSLSNN